MAAIALRSGERGERSHLITKNRISSSLHLSYNYLLFFMILPSTMAVTSSISLSINLNEKMLTNNGNYHPSDIVRYFHRLPHLNHQLQRVSNQFHITSESRWNSYTDSLVPFPVIMGVIGVFLILIPLAILVSRYWCRCAKCLPKIVNEYLTTMQTRSPSRNSTFTTIVLYRKYALSSFVICLLIVIILNQGVFLGEVARKHSVNKAKDSLTSMKHTFNDLTYQGYGLEKTGEVIENDLTLSLSTCPEAESIFPPLQVYQESVDTYVEIVEPLPSRLGDLESYLYYWAVSFRNQMIWLIYGMIWMILGIFLMSICMQSQGSLKVGIGIGFFFTAALFSLMAALIYLMMMSADFCMNPTSNALGLCEPDYRPIATYYSSCNGTNPITEPIEVAFVSLEIIEHAVLNLTKPGGECELNPYLLHCTRMVNYAHGNLTVLVESAQCPPVKEDWDEFFREAVCHDGYYALYLAWVTDYSTVFAMYITLLVGCLSYQYIGSQWKLDFEDLEEGGMPSDQSDYYYQKSLDAADRVHSTPFSYFFNRFSRGAGSDGSGSGKSPVGDYNVLSSYYIDSNTVTPLLSFMSQDSDETQENRPESKRSSGRHTQEAVAPGSNRSSKKLTPDLLPSHYYTKY